MDIEARQKEFEAVFESHADELFRHSFLRISDREKALELTQETFLRAWKYVAQGEEIANYRSFLYRILNNLVVDHYRKHKSESLDELLEAETEEGGEIHSALLKDDHDPWEEAMQRFDGGIALRALKDLPENYRTVIMMRYLDGLMPQEIARILNESENTVSVRIHRALKRLREELAQYE